MPWASQQLVQLVHLSGKNHQVLCSLWPPTLGYHGSIQTIEAWRFQVDGWHVISSREKGVIYLSHTCASLLP